MGVDVDVARALGLDVRAVEAAVGGSAADRSARLSFVSVPPVRRTAFVRLVPVAAAEPSKVVELPYPTRSTTAGSASTVDGAPVRGVVVRGRARVPPPPANATVDATSGVGRSAPGLVVALLLFAPTSRVPPAGTVWSPRAITPEKFPVPVAERYWTDQPATSTGLPVGLCTSTYLFLNDAPLEPPFT